MKNARRKLGMKLFRKVRDILDGFGEKHPEAGEAVVAKWHAFLAEFKARRTQHFQREARLHFTDTVQDFIADKVREKDISILDVIAWTRRELPDEALAKLAGKMEKLDDVTPEEARAFWDGRSRKQWRSVTYGAGTFIVRPPQVKLPRGRGPSSGGGGAAPAFQPPKPPTADQWWTRAKMSEREKWIFAYFVENSELFEIGDPKLKPCPLCHGAGLISKTLQTGNVWTYLCTRCGGARSDVTVKYR